VPAGATRPEESNEEVFAAVKLARKLKVSDLKGRKITLKKAPK
jgi:hypothetical protein